MNMKKALSVVNAILLVLLIAWNYYSNTGAVNGETVGSLSDKYSSLLVPADYAFTIWGLIYTGLAASSAYFIFLAFKNRDENDVIKKAVPPLLVANMANALWLWFWLNEYLLFSVLTMSVILISLIVAIIRLNMERWDAPLKHMALVWWPIDLYSGWISVALSTNVASYLNNIGVVSFFSEELWTVLLIAMIVLLNLFMTFNRNMREFAAVGIWALVALSIRHWMEIPSLGLSAAAGALILGLASAYHAEKHKNTLPHKKIKRGEL